MLVRSYPVRDSYELAASSSIHDSCSSMPLKLSVPSITFLHRSTLPRTALISLHLAVTDPKLLLSSHLLPTSSSTFSSFPLQKSRTTLVARALRRRKRRRRLRSLLSIIFRKSSKTKTSSEKPNKLLSAGYERAIEKCRRKVKKIIQECRRDLEKGHYLNTLGHTNASIPKAVKRVHEIFKKPTFLKNVNGRDLIATLTTLANVEGGIQRIYVKYNTRISIYDFSDGSKEWTMEKSQFNEKFQVKLSKDRPLYAFRIHFRIHKRDRPSTEDYIVRSHGNYLIDRSYSIFISITKVARLRKIKEQRHTNRDVTKQQTKKNNEKRDRKRTKKAEVAKAKANLEAAQKAAAEAKKAKEAKLLKDAEAKKKDVEKPKDQAVQTEVTKEEPKEEPKEESKDVATGDSKTDSTNESKEEPKDGAKKDATDDKPADKPAPSPAPTPAPAPPAQKSYDSDSNSKPRLTPARPPKRHNERYESEEEGLPDPWNAICIVGVRVYSMDEDLEVRVIIEGSELLEGSMGKKGEADIDNAQVNAGGERERLEADSADATKPDVNAVIQKTEESIEDAKDDKDETNEDSKSEKLDKNSVNSTDYDKLHSRTSTLDVITTPEATPLEFSLLSCMKGVDIASEIKQPYATAFFDMIWTHCSYHL
ncbi:calpain family cysteine protease [Colletotrichum cuscutae]|uniref:Calpain family cysteine protease n=1 Tax=Colletotrichum cuscutae TaxID=1209917 RepID=A0AAI9Y0D0_9PEZI|nr:calpain family cysteine protease [Colletotrichum cuscutae]